MIFSYVLVMAGVIAIVLISPSYGKGVSSLDRGMILEVVQYAGIWPYCVQLLNSCVSFLTIWGLSLAFLRIVSLSPSTPTALFPSELSALITSSSLIVFTIVRRAVSGIRSGCPSYRLLMYSSIVLVGMTVPFWTFLLNLEAMCPLLNMLELHASALKYSSGALQLMLFASACMIVSGRVFIALRNS